MQRFDRGHSFACASRKVARFNRLVSRRAGGGSGGSPQKQGRRRRRETFLDGKNPKRRGFDFQPMGCFSSARSRPRLQIAEHKKGRFMLRSIKQSYGNKLGAARWRHRPCGLLFRWSELGHPLSGRGHGNMAAGTSVLILPSSLGQLDQAKKVLRVNLTRKQVEVSPSIDLQKPVSRWVPVGLHPIASFPAPA